MSPSVQVTAFLKRMSAGEVGAVSRVVSLLYTDLKKIAEVRMRRERPGHTLEPAALVNEALLGLLARNGTEWQNRSHFLASASEEMRRILVDYARARNSLKRGGYMLEHGLTGDAESADNSPEQLLQVSEMLCHLAEEDPRMGKIAEMRCFGGLTHKEIGEVLGVDARTVKRDWTVAKAWLRSQFPAGV